MGNSFTFFIDPSYDFEERKAIAKASIRYIVDRTRSGKAIGGKSLGTYSKNYMKQREFITAGKEGEKKVNLTLTGDMLDSIEALDVTIAGRIVIGFIDGPESDRSTWMEDKGYNFLGLDQSEIDTVMADFPEATASLKDILKIFQAG